ncbi:outer membrane protein assembly factor [Chitinophagaceae bacterium LB-8]|uniref:Outer membrane protein assembly factor n=1 Tax=Paraflavisolibacter caeni TaxID=2982496 RepID=A0A9X3BH77_9BACT|nr:BamA/TamA family outer membrane protein [Paraflavisolibacter caeni]MCU7549082.1 outer membrane protein assembly factor [Paraflavisolibacter caeni]
MINQLKRFNIVIALLIATQFAFGQLKPDSTKKPVKFAAIPIITYNRTQGICIGASTSAFYKVNKEDTVSPPSYTGLMGIYTAEKSWVAGIGQQFYLKEDKWRVRAYLIKGDVNYQFFNEDANDNVGQFEDYANDVVIAMMQIQRKIWKRLYGGLFGEYNNTKTYFTSKGDSLDERNMSNIGYVFSQDSRDNVYFPTTGIFMNFRNQFHRDWTGSDNNFTRFQINYNHFFDVLKDQRHIMIARLNFDIATGDIPFQGQGIVGRDDVRGYSQGKYRGNQVYALQSEYRWMFSNSKFGMVGFLGVASAVESFSDIFNTSLLPGVGAGLRYRIIPSMKVNVGVDVGFGKDDYSLTFRIGESFAR